MNDLIQYILSAVSSMIPLFVFLVVLRIILQGTSKDAAGLGIAILLSVGITAISLLAETLSLLKLGLSPAQAFKKLSAAFLLALSTASSAAAYSSMMECAEKNMGVDKKFVNFAIPLGSVTFMPQSVNIFMVIPLFACMVYNIPVTWGELILCLISAVIMSVAAPPIPGGAISCFALLFMQLGIPAEGLSLAVAACVVLDFTAMSGNVYELLVQTTLGASSMNMLNEEVLHAKQ